MSFTEKLTKTSTGNEEIYLKFPNGYCIWVSRESFFIRRKEKIYTALLMKYKKPHGWNSDTIDVTATCETVYEGITIKRQETVRLRDVSEQAVNDFIEQVKSLPKICDAPDTWKD